MIKTIQLEVFTTAFQIEMNQSDFVIVYSRDTENNYYKKICLWNHFEQQLQEIKDFKTPAIIHGKIIGWSKIPYFFQ